MNELTINNTELTERASGLLKQINDCLENITTRTSELTIYFSEIVKAGVEQKALVEITGLSKSTISKMVSTSGLYITFFLNFFPIENVEEFDCDYLINDSKLMSIPYSKMYIAKDIIVDSDSMLYKLTYNDAIDYLRNVKVVNNAIECSDNKVVVDDNTDEAISDDIADCDTFTLTIHKDNIPFLIEILSDSDCGYDWLTKDLVKQLEKAI